MRIGNRARTLGEHVSSRLGDVIVQSREDKALHVQHDVGDVLDNALSRGELMLHALDLDGGRFRAVKRGEQHATQAVAKSMAVTALERLDNVASHRVVDFFRCYSRPHELCHVLKASLLCCDYFE